MIEDNTFSNLPNLQNLSLYSNQITSIKSDMFNNLINLTNLVLSFNNISVIEDNAFNHLLILQNLYLYGNKITSIKSDAFSNLTNLNKLSLTNNPISFVSESAFVNLPKLTSLDLHMYCGGCENIPFWRWLRKQTTTSVTCNDYDGKSLAILEPNNLTDCFRDPCYSNPCLGNGLCINDGKGSALCSCHGDWTGSQCQLSPCSTLVCYGGECYYNESGIAKCFYQTKGYYQVSPCSTLVCYDGECYYNESGIAKCFYQTKSYYQVTTHSVTTYSTLFASVGIFTATALGAVIIVLVTLRYRRTKKQQNRRTTLTNDYIDSGFHHTEPHYVSAIPMVQEQNYDTMQTPTALCHT